MIKTKQENTKNSICSKKVVVINRGQAMITLLFFALIGIIIITAASVILYTNISALTTAESGTYAYYVAESGVEEAILRLIRNPTYTGGTITVGADGTATVVVQNGVITSTGKYGNLVRKVQVKTVTDANGVSASSWKEINQ